ncbi:MAG: hypothetical protein V1809_05765 [Planctomycetota bacterium]
MALPRITKIAKAMVPGGWIVRAGISKYSIATIFIVDPGHGWHDDVLDWYSMGNPRTEHALRANVPGGWLILTWGMGVRDKPNCYCEILDPRFVSLVFVPDPSHAWVEDSAPTAGEVGTPTEPNVPGAGEDASRKEST